MVNESPTATVSFGKNWNPRISVAGGSGSSLPPPMFNPRSHAVTAISKRTNVPAIFFFVVYS